jgi:hypothetical protein
MFPGASAPPHSGTWPSDENWDDRKSPERQEVDGSRNGVTGLEIPPYCHPPNPQHERELDQQHEAKLASRLGQRGGIPTRRTAHYAPNPPRRA